MVARCSNYFLVPNAQRRYTKVLANLETFFGWGLPAPIVKLFVGLGNNIAFYPLMLSPVYFSTSFLPPLAHVPRFIHTLLFFHQLQGFLGDGLFRDMTQLASLLQQPFNFSLLISGVCLNFLVDCLSKCFNQQVKNLNFFVTLAVLPPLQPNLSEIGKIEISLSSTRVHLTLNTVTSFLPVLLRSLW